MGQDLDRFLLEKPLLISSKAMITGINTVYEHEGRNYHLQAEDLGEEAQVFEVRVYDQGSVLWQKRVGYQDLISQELAKHDFEQALRGKMEKPCSPWKQPSPKASSDAPVLRSTVGFFDPAGQLSQSLDQRL